MLLYLWVNKFKHIEKTGFNLSSKYEFDFQLVSENRKSKEIVGNLSCVKKSNPKIFNEQIIDVKAIVGENGAGKSTIFEILIQNIMTEPVFNFDGFLVSDKFIFNRKGIHFGDSISKIKYFNLKEVPNVDLVNIRRDDHQRKLKPDEVQDSYNGQIATGHLDYLSIIHYSPLLNIDRVFNIEGVAGSRKSWVTDYWHYYDFTTENCIVEDYHSFSIGEASYYISGESELLAHKTEESRRNLKFLSEDIFVEFPFKNMIEYVSIQLNNFYEKFWESIDIFLKKDDELQGKIGELITSISEKDFKGRDKLKELESNLYLSFIYGALKYEFETRMNFGSRGNSNALLSTIDLFQKTTSRTRIHKTTLENFLKESIFARNFSSSLFNKIKKAVNYIIESRAISDKGSYGFSIPLSNLSEIKKFMRIFYDDFIFNNDEGKRSYIFSIFTIEFVGLSSGEKNLLSMFSRIKRASETIPPSQSYVVFLLDEPEVTLHPQWQTYFMKLLNDNLPKLFSKKKLQILITSHSPILISDLPKNNILFLEKDVISGKCKVSNLKNKENTFGANIHSLYADAFFLKEKGGAMGLLAKEIINKMIIELDKDIPENPLYLKKIISMIGEPLIQNQLFDLFYHKFPEYRIKDIDSRILFLENELAAIKKNKERNNETS